MSSCMNCYKQGAILSVMPRDAGLSTVTAPCAMFLWSRHKLSACTVCIIAVKHTAWHGLEIADCRGNILARPSCTKELHHT